MRDYKKAAEGLRYCSEHDDCGSRCPYFIYIERNGDCVNGVMCDAADAIEELLAAVPEWISVEERLPEESGYTIVFCADGELRHVTFAKYQKTQKRWDLTGARSYWRITHWMPLPAPPEGD